MFCINRLTCLSLLYVASSLPQYIQMWFSTIWKVYLVSVMFNQCHFSNKQFSCKSDAGKIAKETPSASQVVAGSK